MGIALSAPLLAQEFETFVAKALYHLRSVTYHLSNRPQERPAVLHGLPRFADVEPGANIAAHAAVDHGPGPRTTALARGATAGVLQTPPSASFEHAGGTTCRAERAMTPGTEGAADRCFGET